MFALGYIGTLIMGVSLGLVGAGGSILIVPVLVYLMGQEPAVATAYSLFVVGIASLIGAGGYAKRGLIDYRTAAVFAAPSFIGVFLVRRFLIPALPEVILDFDLFALTKDNLIMGVFAVVMLLASVSMIRRGSRTLATSSTEDRAFNYPLIAAEGLVVGAVTGFVGAGGGFLIIPALVTLAKVPIKQAVGTSLLIIAIKSLFGVLGDITASQALDWTLMISISLVAVCGIFVGMKLSHKVPGKKLEPAFGWFVLMMGIFILSQQVIA